MDFSINNSVFKIFPELESERLLFRSISSDDSKEIFLIRSDDEVMKYLDTNKHTSIEESINLIISIQESYKNKTGINWAIVEKETNSFAGYFGFWRIIPEHCRAEIGYALKPEFWGKGFMAETLNVMLKFGFQTLKLHSVEANVNPNNAASIKALEKTGFKKEAYFRENFLFNKEFLDSVIYSLLEKDMTNKDA